MTKPTPSENLTQTIKASLAEPYSLRNGIEPGEIKMEERIDRLESLLEASVLLAETMQRNHDRMRENHRRNEENWRLMEERWQDYQRRNEENNRRNEENWRLMEESQDEIRDLLQRLTQAVAVMQAEIVRIDETHA